MISPDNIILQQEYGIFYVQIMSERNSVVVGSNPAQTNFL